MEEMIELLRSIDHKLAVNNSLLTTLNRREAQMSQATGAAVQRKTTEQRSCCRTTPGLL
jgi:hypothetical protein